MSTQGFWLRRLAALGVSTVIVGMLSLSASAQGTPAPAGQAPAVVALTAEAQALKAVLVRRFGAGSEVVASYQATGFRPIWTGHDGNARAAILVDALKRAGEHALPTSKYNGVALEGRLSSSTPALEADLTAAYLAYATDIGSGLLEPRQIDRELIIEIQRPLASNLIAAAATTADMAAHMASLPPADPAYARLVERYAAFRMPGTQDLWGETVGKGRTLRPGDRHQRVASVRARLTAMGDLDPNIYDQQAGAEADGTLIATNEIATDVPIQAFDPALFDQPMVEALQSFQARHGLNLDGVIGPATLGQINVTRDTRAAQIAVNLERLRWMNRDLGDRHILVNLAGFTMAIMENGKEAFTSRVVVGKAREHRTPEFSEIMTHMVVNPSWHVPRSIATKEILPKLKANPGYLAARGMRLVGADASAIDWSTVTPGTFPGRITQKPGRGNALGTVKFMFPNRWAIYLHDTPSKRLFGRDIRAFSHGCVRVEKPHALAAFLLRGQQADPEGYFKGILRTKRERRVNLDQPLPVHLTYRSAWIDEQGVEQFRGDIYGRDRKIAAALTKAGVAVTQ